LRKDCQSTLVVAQTWNEIHSVNEQIRVALKQEKLVDEVDAVVTTFQPGNLTDAQKRDERSYDDKTVLVFNRDMRGFKAGESARMRGVTGTHLIVESDGRVASILFKHLDRITVCQQMELPLSSGDRLQLKANGRSEDNCKLANGELVTVKEVHDDGRVLLADGRVLPSRFRQFVRGYAVTSYASQGKTVDHVLFSDSAVKAATNQQQWYVTISRARKGVEIFTTNKQQLREQITRSGDRPLAMGLTPKTRNSWFHQAIEQRYGPRVAGILSKKRQARIHLKNLQRVRQAQSLAARQSRGHGMGI
jgi:ATP-dependent exoDNAse (exonuclease V) alpha subunit